MAQSEKKESQRFCTPIKNIYIYICVLVFLRPSRFGIVKNNQSERNYLERELASI